MSDVQDDIMISKSKVYFNVVGVRSAICMHIHGFKGGCCIAVPCRILCTGAYARFEVM